MMSSARQQSSGTPQVWLPNLGVWAAARPLSISSKGTPSRSEIFRGNDRKPAKTQPSANTGFELQQQVSDHDMSSDDVEEIEPPPHCSICLLDVVNLEEKAVLHPCMHAYHHDCISQWLDRKHLCPLCKTRVHSVLYDIKSVSEYKERDVPPTPPASRSPPAISMLRRTAATDVDLERSMELLYSRSPFSSGRHGSPPRPFQGFRSGDGLGSWGSDRPGRAPARRAGGGRASRGAAAAGDAPREPRPYFWRVHRSMQAAGGGGSGGARGDGASNGGGRGEDGGLAWRRQVYEQGLYAQPLPPCYHRPHTFSARHCRERRMSDWLDRELRAVLRCSDITVIKGFVTGLLALNQLEPPGAASGAPGPAGDPLGNLSADSLDSPPSGGGVPTGTSHSSGLGRGGGEGGGRSLQAGVDPVQALRPFLHDRAEHFWHELRCFAFSPFTQQTYDRIMPYSSTPPPGASRAAGQLLRSRQPGSAQRQRGTVPQPGTVPQRLHRIEAMLGDMRGEMHHSHGVLQGLLSARDPPGGHPAAPQDQRARPSRLSGAGLRRDGRGGSCSCSPPPPRRRRRWDQEAAGWGEPPSTAGRPGGEGTAAVPDPKGGGSLPGGSLERPHAGSEQRRRLRLEEVLCRDMPESPLLGGRQREARERSPQHAQQQQQRLLRWRELQQQRGMGHASRALPAQGSGRGEHTPGWRRSSCTPLTNPPQAPGSPPPSPSSLQRRLRERAQQAHHRQRQRGSSAGVQRWGHYPGPTPLPTTSPQRLEACTPGDAPYQGVPSSLAEAVGVQLGPSGQDTRGAVPPLQHVLPAPGGAAGGSHHVPPSQLQLERTSASALPPQPCHAGDARGESCGWAACEDRGQGQVVKGGTGAQVEGSDVSAAGVWSAARSRNGSGHRSERRGMSSEEGDVGPQMQKRSREGEGERQGQGRPGRQRSRRQRAKRRRKSVSGTQWQKRAEQCSMQDKIPGGSGAAAREGGVSAGYWEGCGRDECGGRWEMWEPGGGELQQ